MGEVGGWGGVFVFKQKTAYEIEYGLVGSEMCIRDRAEGNEDLLDTLQEEGYPTCYVPIAPATEIEAYMGCLLYTSDAADERSSVDLGGRRIIKKKTQRS